MKQGYLIRMPQTLKDALARRAEMIGISMNALLIQILWDYVTSKSNKVTKA